MEEMVFDTYLQKLLCTGDIEDKYIGTNILQIVIPSDNFEDPPTFINKGVLILKSDDNVQYSITEEQLEIEKDIILSKYPDKAQDIISNYNILKEKIEV